MAGRGRTRGMTLEQRLQAEREERCRDLQYVRGADQSEDRKAWEHNNEEQGNETKSPSLPFSVKHF